MHSAASRYLPEHQDLLPFPTIFCLAQDHLIHLPKGLQLLFVQLENGIESSMLLEFLCEGHSSEHKEAFSCAFFHSSSSIISNNASSAKHNSSISLRALLNTKTSVDARRYTCAGVEFGITSLVSSNLGVAGTVVCSELVHVGISTTDEGGEYSSHVVRCFVAVRVADTFLSRIHCGAAVEGTRPVGCEVVIDLLVRHCVLFFRMGSLNPFLSWIRE